MTTIEANNIAIKEYLANLGMYPVKEKDNYGMYYSPLREERDASFKVDYRQNLWYDFGTGEGGTLLDLVMKQHTCSLPEAIQKLEIGKFVPASFSFHGKEEVSPAILITNVQPITNKALLDYLSERKVNIEIAKQYCQELHYSVNGKPYFAIGFRNDVGGYELRNKYFKGCTLKDLTTFDKGFLHCCLFEGFMDMLSCFTLKNKASIETNVLVLNSVANLSKAMNFLNSQEAIHAFLDNDEAGKQALTQVQLIGKTVVDWSTAYRGFKDLNEYLCQQKPPRPQIKMKR